MSVSFFHVVRTTERRRVSPKAALGSGNPNIVVRFELSPVILGGEDGGEENCSVV